MLFIVSVTKSTSLATAKDGIKKSQTLIATSFLFYFQEKVTWIALNISVKSQFNYIFTF